MLLLGGRFIFIFYNHGLEQISVLQKLAMSKTSAPSHLGNEVLLMCLFDIGSSMHCSESKYRIKPELDTAIQLEKLFLTFSQQKVFALNLLK